MHLIFGLQLDGQIVPKPRPGKEGTRVVGPNGLVQIFESYLGLTGHPTDEEHLRIVQYRSALRKCAEEHNEAFYSTSLQADGMGTAATLLAWRDELRLSGWNFDWNEQTPSRLKDLAIVEEHLQTSPAVTLNPGFAGRFLDILDTLQTREHPIQHIKVLEPPSYLPPHFQRLFAILKEQGVTFEALPELAGAAQGDLATWQRMLQGSSTYTDKIPLQGDGSLLILKAQRETDLAGAVAKLIQINQVNLRPTCVIPEQNRKLEEALIQEGLPSMGVLSASLARPTLQILKLVPTFFWEPIDPYKILEFLTLPLKPLNDDLAFQIARLISERPGLGGDQLSLGIKRFFDALDERTDITKKQIRLIRYAYNFWFERKRYPITGQVPKQEVIEVFEFIAQWAIQTYADLKGKKRTSLVVLSEQAKRIRDILLALPPTENQLSNLEVERIVRTVYESSPIEFKTPEQSHLPYVHHLSAILQDQDQILWWNFLRNEPDYFFSRWYAEELAFLAQKEVVVFGPKEQNRLLLWQRNRPVLAAKKQLLLCLPTMVDGTEAYPHPLHDEIHARFEDLEKIIIDLDQPNQMDHLQKYFKPLPFETYESIQLGVTDPFIQLPAGYALHARAQETFTSLDSLFYYPYQWVFRYQLKLRKSSILSVSGDRTLKGNLAHRFVELILKEEEAQWTKEKVAKWIDRQAPQLLAREGAVLLMYGREPERIAYLQQIKFATWSLIKSIQDNQWTLHATEKSLDGDFCQTAVKGIADLILERGNEKAIVDLKWRGRSYRERRMKSLEDLQLQLYASLLQEGKEPIHTSYFILSEGRFVARNNEAFKHIVGVAPDANASDIHREVLNRMEQTYHWRMQQLQEGLIEIRTTQTAIDLEDAYVDIPFMEMLEMRSEDAKFDDYRTLIGGNGG